MATKELTYGKPLNLILAFMFPIFIGNIFQQCYNLVDALIVGRTIGIKALGAVGACAPLIFFFISFIFSSTQGFTVVLAQKFGARDYKNVRKSLSTSLVLSAILTFALTALSAPFSYQFLKLLNTPTDIIDLATTYGLGDYFLKEYLKYVIQSNRNELNGIKSYKVPTVFDIDCWNMSDIEVRREYKNIDLLLIDETNKFIFLIENKVDSFQHDNQLEKYRQIVDTEYSSNDYKKLFVYLKPKAEEVEKPYIFVNYKSVHETINKLLEMKSDVISDEINMAISHYKQILERDIMNEDEIKEICLKIYKNHKRAIDLINEHIQTTPKGMLEILDEVINKLGWIKLDSQNSIIRCIPKSFDIRAYLEQKCYLMVEVLNIFTLAVL